MYHFNGKVYWTVFSSLVFIQFTVGFHTVPKSSISIGENVTKIVKRAVDTTFYGHPKTQEERWHENFKINLLNLYSTEADSLVQLLNKVVQLYLSQCIPIIFYDKYVEESESILLETFLKKFQFTYLHGKTTANYTVINKNLLNPIDNSCRSYILFLSDILKAREILGPQTVNRVIIISRSTQWKQQEFLSTKASSDIINLLVISKSLSTRPDMADAYVLYTHRLYTDGLASNKPTVLTSWINGKLSRPHVNLFPTKFVKGFAGHRFIISTIHQPPYVIKKLSTDTSGSININWDGLEFRIIRLLAKRLNFTFEIIEPKDHELGPTFGVLEDISKRRADIGLAGAYVTIDRLQIVEMSVQHSKDCAAFITLVSKALPRYRAIMGPFQWPVWLAVIAIYIIAIFPLAFSDRLTLKHLIGNWGEMENMFWYVFGTFTNSLTFSGQFSWSNTKKNSTRMLIGWYWVFTIIITSCYTGSIIAFVTLPVFPDTVDSLGDLLSGFYRIGTLKHDGWQFWFKNSSHSLTRKLLKDLEFVADVEEGLSNVTKAFFWPYAFLGSRSQLEHIVETNFTDETIGKRTALHVSNECLSIFGISILFPSNAVYVDRINSAILRLQQFGLIAKLNNEMVWDKSKGAKHVLFQGSSVSKKLQPETEERGLTLADTEGMFLLMGIGYLIGVGVLISEIIGGCANKCRKIVRKVSITSVQISRRESSAKTIRRNSSAQVRVSVNNESHRSTSSESLEITQKMLRRKSNLDYSLNPFKNIYNRHQRNPSLASNKDNISVQSDLVVKRSSLNGFNEENQIDNRRSSSNSEHEHFGVTKVQINRACTPYQVENTFGEKIDD